MNIYIKTPILNSFRKIVLVILILPLIFSCSENDSDSNSNSSQSILLKKSIWDNEITYIYSYIGNKITKIEGSDGTLYNYTYTGDLITKVDYKENNLIGRDEFYYSGMDLIQIKVFENNVLKRKIDYFKIDNNSIKRTHTLYNGSTTSTVIYKEYYLNDELFKEEKLNSNGSVNFTTTFYYDDKNYIHKNVIGYKNISSWYKYGGPQHNVSKKISSNSTENYTYVYDSKGFPISEISNSNGFTETFKYFY